MRSFLIQIWPTSLEAHVGPMAYYTEHKMFPRRPGAGWMLYLPAIIQASDLPEAAGLLPVMVGGQQKGETLKR